MCCEYAENELQRQWTAVIILILFSLVKYCFYSVLCCHILWWNKGAWWEINGPDKGSTCRLRRWPITPRQCGIDLTNHQNSGVSVCDWLRLAKISHIFESFLRREKTQSPAMSQYMKVDKNVWAIFLWWPTSANLRPGTPHRQSDCPTPSQPRYN